jgi:response regulator RpfG family c-di-GMP phosphodiesterase
VRAGEFSITSQVKQCNLSMALFLLCKATCNLNSRILIVPHHESSILIVDDTQANLLALQATLEGMPADIVLADSGKEALRCLLSDDFAAILLDVRMPVMDGFETATLIRQRDQTRRIPIIFLTAHEEDEGQVSRAYSLGAVDYIRKPFNPDILKAKVKVFLNLHARNRQLRDAELAREREQLTSLSNNPATGLTAEMFGTTLLRVSAPAHFEQLVQTYQDLLVRCLESRSYKTDQQDAEYCATTLRVIVQELGYLNAGPRDVIDLHTTALKKACDAASPQKCRAFSEEGRLLIVELMGYLVSYYRNHAPLHRGKLT